MRSWVCRLVVFATSATALVSLAQSPAALPITIGGKLDSATGHLLIPVTIGGHRFWCNPDTGASALVALDPDKAAAAGLRTAADASTPDGHPGPARDSSISGDLVVGGVTFPHQSISLRTFAEQADLDMDCIFGVALLHRFVVEFDYTTPALALYERSAFQPAAGAEKIPLTLYTNPRVPFVDIQVSFTTGPRESLRVVPDTGTSLYSAIMVGGAAARVKARVQKSAMAITYPDPEPGRLLQVTAARPGAIIVGSFSIKEPIVAFVSGNLGSGGIADGTLGEGFFRRFTAAFDFDGHAMYLQPTDRLAEASPFDAGGIGFVRRNGRDVVFTVLADSSGAKAGVRVGDVLRTIDDRQAANLTLVDVRNLLSLPGRNGRTRRLVLERDGRTVAVRINLTPRL